MNKHCYRLIFSRTHGELRVVSELARSRSNEPGQHRGASGGSRLWVTLRCAVWLLGLALFAGPVMADGIIADGSAASGQRPGVIVTQNGLPQVNITAPNQAGISHNQYRQFDVDQKGAILNNSAVMTATQMAGMIQGNPNLNPNSAPARVILNEVNSTNPSQLRGFLEVAGGKAQVIVANPAGIVCSGCGTINAGRMTLTTGKPQLNADGNLAGYQVERGVVRVEGGGLNGDVRHDTEYVDILARAVEINAGVWAKEGVSVVAGRNRVSADGTTATPLSDDGSDKPLLAIDMGQMGGMYSGSIRMIGTEAGVGVRNQNAQVQAGKMLTVSSEGKLIWQSDAQNAATQAGGDISLAARDDIDYQGKLHAGSQLSVQSRDGMLTQSGTLAAAGDVHLNAARGIESSGHLLAGSDVNSQIVHEASLQLESQGDVRASGSLLSKKDVSATGRRVDIGDAKVAARKATLSARESGVALRRGVIDSEQLVINTAGDIDAQQAQVKAGRWQVDANNLFNQQAIWSQTESGESRFTLAGRLDNSDGAIESRQLSFSAAALTNQRGHLLALDNAAQAWRVGGLLDNAGGELGSNGDLRLDVGSVDNQNGTIKTQATLALYSSGTVNNVGGKLLSGHALTLSTDGTLNNQSGTLNGGQLTLMAGQLNNVQGELISQGDFSLTAGWLNNQHGLVLAGKGLDMHTGDWDNRNGTAQGETSLTMVANALNNDDGKLLSGQHLTLNAAGELSNRSGEISGKSLTLTTEKMDNAAGKIIAQNDADLTSHQGLNNASGWLEAGKALSLNVGGDWDNREGTAQGGQQVTAAARALDNTGGRLQSGGDLTWESAGDIVNREGKLTAQQTLVVKAGETSLIDNDGGSLQSGGTFSLQGGRLTNRQSGFIFSQGELSLSLAEEWDNQGGQLTGNGSTWIRAANLLNAQGAINALDSLDMQFTGSLDNGQGRIFSKLSQRLEAQDIINAQGWMGSQGSWQAVSNNFDNTEGSVQSQQNGQLAASWLNNAKGVLQSAADLTLRVLQEIDNRGGKVSAQGQLAVQGSAPGDLAGAINNAGGQWLAGEALNIAALSLNNMQSGQLYSQQQLRLNLTGELDNRSGKLQSGEALSLDAQALHNAGGTIDSQQALTLRILSMLDNSGGFVRSNGDQQVTAGNIDNRQGVFSSLGGIDLTTTQLNNAGGTLIGQGAGSLHIDTLNNQQGKVHSGASLAIDAAQVDNRGGQLVATQGMTLNADVLDNSGQGTLSSQTSLEVLTDRLNNRDGGLILGTTHTAITARDIDNAAGRLQSAGTLTLSAVSLLDNRQGHILANGNLDLNAGMSPTDSPLALLNQGGRLESAGAMTLHTRTLDNQNGTLLGLQALTLTAQQDYTHSAGETLSSNGTLTFTLSGVFNNLADWLLPGNLILNAASITNPTTLVAKTLQLTTGGALQNTGRLEADTMMLSVDTLDNSAALMGDDITVRGRVIDNHGQPAVIAATQNLRLQAGERLSNRDGALLYSGDRLHLHSDDQIENRASFIEADGDATIEARRLDNLREGLEIERDAEKSDYKWHRYNYYWRSYGSKVNTDKSTMAPTTQQMTFQDDAAAQTNRYGTLLTIDAAGKRAQVRVKDNKGQLTDLWVNYLALTPNADGSYAMTFYETRGSNQMAAIPTPYQNGFHREFDRIKVVTWDPENYVDIDSAPFVTDYNNFRERTESGTVTRDRLVSEGIGARILSGGNMLLRISGQLLNDASTITANGNLTQDGGGVDNRGYSVNERRQAIIVDHYDKDTKHWYPTFNLDETTALTTIDGIITGNGNVTINGASITNTTVNQAQIGQLQAALNAVDAERAELERNPLAFTVEGAGGQTGDASLASGTTATSPSGRPLLPAELALTRMQQLESVATTIPNNGLFAQHTAAGSPFLVVTDTRFTSREKFISSDYLLTQVGYDPAQVHKRLGDGFYEQRLVREQVLQLTGKPSVRGEDAMAQYQLLMNNGVKVAAEFHLIPGVALTPEQIAALEQDIVWLVSETVQTVDGPQTVWVPKVYLAQTTLRLTGDGAVIGGGNLQLSAESITNAGNLFADKALTVDAGQFLHQGGDIRAGSIDVQADTLSMSTNLQDALRQATMSAGDISLRGTDITLAGAALTATENLSLSASNNLTITTARSTKTADIEVIAGSTGNRKDEGMEEPGKRMAQVSGEWQQALGSSLTAGGNLSLSAGRDVALTGSQAQAEGTLSVQAGGNVSLLSDTTTNDTHLQASSSTSSVSNSRYEERLVASGLSGDGGVTVVAGADFAAVGSQVASRAGDIAVSAQQVTIEEARQQVIDQDSESNRVGKTKSQREMTTASNTGTGSGFSAQGDISVTARAGDITVQGSSVESEKGAVGLKAVGDIAVVASQDTYDMEMSGSSKTKKTLSKKESKYQREEHSSTASGSLISGQSVALESGENIRVAGSSVVATDDVSLKAGNDITVTTAENHYHAESVSQSKKSGFSGTGGIGVSYGTSKLKTQESETTLTYTGSAIGSTGGSVTMSAGNNLTVKGSDVLAGQDISLSGKQVDILAAENHASQRHKTEQKTSGLTLALSGAAGSALNSAVSTVQQARKESDGRLGALQGMKAAMDGVSAQQAYELDGLQTGAADSKNAAAGLKPGDDGYEKGATSTIGVSVSYGRQSSKSESSLSEKTQQGSTLTAGNNLRITATGTDVNVEGSQLQAGKDVQLSAVRDVNLVSAEESSSTRGSNSSKGGSVGVGLTAGSGGTGVSISASGNRGKGHENADSVSHVETQVNAGSQVTITSGRDATLAGAQVSGETVKAEVGRNLTISSGQDSETYDSKQQSASAGAGYTVGGAATASVNASRDKMNSDWQSVTEQSGIFAGAGGFDITVGEHTQLDGAVIASTATADKNKLDTGTLGWSDIENYAEYEVEHVGAGISTGGSVLDQFKGNMANGVLAGLNGSDSADSTTKAAVSEGTITIRDKENQQQDVATLSHDVENANPGLEQIFDKEKEQNRLKAAQLIAEIGMKAMDIARTEGQIAGEKAKSDPAALAAAREQLAASGKPFTDDDVAKQAYNNAMKPFGTGSALQQGLQAATAAIQGLAGGNIAQAISGAASPYLAEQIHKLTTDANGKVNTEANLMAHAVVGAVTSYAAGNSALAGASGAVMGEFIAQQLYPDIKREDLSEEQRQTISALGTLAAGLAGGVVGDGAADAVAGAQAGKTAVENNWLNSTEARQLDKEMQDCKASGGDCNKVVEKYVEISNGHSKELAEACTGGGVACVSWQELIQGATNVANDAHPSQIRLDEKLKDPTAAALVNYLNGTDLKFLEDNITTGDRVLDVIMTPTSWPVAIMGGKAIITNAVNNTKEQLIAVGVSGAASAGIQYGTTGEVKLSDVIGSIVVGGITAGKGYNPTMIWNAAGGYYQAEISGDDPFMAAVLSKAGASVGYAAGNVLKVQADKILNPVSKQYEWVPTGVWTISKPVSQNPLPSIVGNAGDSAASGLFTDGMNDALKNKSESQ